MRGSARKGEVNANMKTDNSDASAHQPALRSAPNQEPGLGKVPATRIVTTSWDDGDSLDLRVGELLSLRNLPGTFYIPVKGHVKSRHRYERMQSSEMLELHSQGFEIGGHGISHPNLAACGAGQLTLEIESCKQRLEDVLGERVSMFAYPRGRHNQKVIASLKLAGFTGARTTAMMAHELNFDPYRMPTSVHVFPHSRLDYLRNLTRVWNIRRTWVYATHLRCGNNWVKFAKLLFDLVLADGGLWHLFGHSWEIEELQLWDGLKEVLDYVANRPGVLYLANGPIVNMRAANVLGTETCTAPALTSQQERHSVQTPRERQVGSY